MCHFEFYQKNHKKKYDDDDAEINQWSNWCKWRKRKDIQKFSERNFVRRNIELEIKAAFVRHTCFCLASCKEEAWGWGDRKSKERKRERESGKVVAKSCLFIWFSSGKIRLKGWMRELVGSTSTCRSNAATSKKVTINMFAILVELVGCPLFIFYLCDRGLPLKKMSHNMKSFARDETRFHNL